MVYHASQQSLIFLSVCSAKESDESDRCTIFQTDHFPLVAPFLTTLHLVCVSNQDYKLFLPTLCCCTKIEKLCLDWEVDEEGCPALDVLEALKNCSIKSLHLYGLPTQGEDLPQEMLDLLGQYDSCSELSQLGILCFGEIVLPRAWQSAQAEYAKKGITLGESQLFTRS